MKKTIGKCGSCGGRVTVSTTFMSVKPPIPECEKCGAQVDDTAHLPMMTMLPLMKPGDTIQSFCEREGKAQVPGAYHIINFGDKSQ